MTDDPDATNNPRPGPGNAASKRAVRGIVRPFVGYFDHRFQDLHNHLDAQPALDALTRTMHDRFDNLRTDLQGTRDDVAADADTIAELAFTLERFADLFTARMEELAAAFRPDDQPADSSVVELPFAYAAAGALDATAAVATVDGDARLPVGLAALGLRVTALGRPARGLRHPDVTPVDEPLDQWAGPGDPFDAVFALSPATGATGRELVDRCHKLLHPGGFLVLAVPLGAGPPGKQLDELLADWNVERREIFAPVGDGGWRRREQSDAAQPAPGGVALVRAAPRS
jgi:hypothetical protein